MANIAIHSFNGGTIPYAQSVFAGRMGRFFFCFDNNADAMPVTIRVMDESGNPVEASARWQPVDDAQSRLFAAEVTIAAPGRYLVEVATENGETGAVQLTALDKLQRAPGNPFDPAESKYDKIANFYYDIVSHFIPREFDIIECGSSTGHITQAILADGQKSAALIDIRPAPIRKAREIFAAAGLRAEFFVGDYLDHEGHYDLVWSTVTASGFPDPMKDKFIAHSARLAPRLLFICGDTIWNYDDITTAEGRIERGSKVRSGNPKYPAGVRSGPTYPGINAPAICARYFRHVHTGMITQEEGYAGSERFWTYAEGRLEDR